MDTSKAVTHLGLCAGYGGIELGLQRAIPDLRTVALCEIEAFAIANLVSKMEAGLMDPAPIWPNLKTFPWGAFRDRVDILTGGYPCQPFSAAGQRKGKQDPRHLWPWIADGIRLLRPRICFFENVEGHISLGLSDVIEDLAGMGYRTTWGIFSASECGAPHQRKRVFILAVASGFRGAAGLSRSLQRHEGQSGESDDGGGEGCGQLANAENQRRYGWKAERWDSQSGTERPTVWNQPIGQGTPWPSRPGELADANANGSLDEQQPENGWATGATAQCGSQVWPSRPGEQQYGWEPPRVVADSHGIDRSAPAEGREHDQQAGSAGEEMADSGIIDGERWGARSGRRLWSEVDVERAGQAINEGRKVERTVGGNFNEPPSGMDYAELCVTCDNRTDELRLLGNGVVPATAERAFRTLIKELL